MPNIRVQRNLRAHVDNTVDIRTETLLGKEYTVVPVIAMVEGVRYGANQDSPELGLASEFGDTPITWANRPLVLNHPQVNGEFVSANTPTILEDYQFGITMNPEVKDGKLHLEAWIDTARVEELGGDFEETVDRILNKEQVEVSVGFFSDVRPQKGKFNGQAYSGVWTNIKPDHLAILVDTIGACSIEDGCGVPRINQIGEEMAELKTNCSCGGGDGVSVSEETVCTCKDKKKAKSMTSVPVVQSTAPLAIELEVLEEHKGQRALNQAIVDAFVRTQAINSSLLSGDVAKMISMAVRKKFGTYSYLYGYTNDVAVFEKYDEGCGGYVTKQIGINVTDSSVEFVGEPKEVLLQTKIVPQASATTEETNMDPKTQTSPTAQAAPAAEQTAPQVTKVETPVVQEQKLTAQQYIDNAPPEVREALQSAMKLQQDRKAAAIKTLSESKANKFTEDFLKTQTLEVLENMVALLPPSYQGQAAPSQIGFNVNTEKSSETVPAPLVFERKKVA